MEEVGRGDWQDIGMDAGTGEGVESLPEIIVSVSSGTGTPQTNLA